MLLIEKQRKFNKNKKSNLKNAKTAKWGLVSIAKETKSHINAALEPVLEKKTFFLLFFIDYRRVGPQKIKKKLNLNKLQ